jgi:hypothetical protein
MLRRVFWWTFAEVSEVIAASIIRAKLRNIADSIQLLTSTYFISAVRFLLLPFLCCNLVFLTV